MKTFFQELIALVDDCWTMLKKKLCVQRLVDSLSIRFLFLSPSFSPDSSMNIPNIFLNDRIEDRNIPKRDEKCVGEINFQKGIRIDPWSIYIFFSDSSTPYPINIPNIRDF